jgi:N-ethylmaleimide reductase
MRPIGMV